jgi:hypothetical protein
MENKKPVFNSTEFIKRLSDAAGSSEIGEAMSLTYDRYQWAVGLVSEDKWPTFFETEADAKLFSEKHQEHLRDSSDPYNMVPILILELGISSELANQFVQIEEMYLIEIGAM